MDEELKELYPDVVYVEPKTGELRLSTVQVHLYANDVIGPDDRVTLPDDWTPQQPRILEVQMVPDENGLHHTKLSC